MSDQYGVRDAACPISTGGGQGLPSARLPSARRGAGCLLGPGWCLAGGWICGTGLGSAGLGCGGRGARPAAYAGLQAPGLWVWSCGNVALSVRVSARSAAAGRIRAAAASAW